CPTAGNVQDSQQKDKMAARSMLVFLCLTLASISTSYELTLSGSDQSVQTMINDTLQTMTSGDLIITFAETNYTNIGVSVSHKPKVNIYFRGPVSLPGFYIVADHVGNITFQDISFNSSVFGMQISNVGQLSIYNCSFFGLLSPSPQPSIYASNCTGVTISKSSFAYLNASAINLHGVIPNIDINNCYFTYLTPFLSYVIEINTITSNLSVSQIQADNVNTFGAFMSTQFGSAPGNVSITNSVLSCGSSSVIIFQEGMYGSILVANNRFEDAFANSQLSFRNITTRLLIIRDNTFPNGNYFFAPAREFLPLRSVVILISGTFGDVHLSNIITARYRSTGDSAFLSVGCSQYPAKIDNLRLDGLYLLQNQLTPVMIYNSTVFNFTVDRSSFQFNHPNSLDLPLGGCITSFGSNVTFTRISNSLLSSNQGVSTIYIPDNSTGLNQYKSIVIDNITATYNSAQSGANVSRPQIIISNSRFTSNTASLSGGAIYISGYEAPSSGIYNCSFSYNQVRSSGTDSLNGGGAIYIEQSSKIGVFTIDRCNFESNSSPSNSRSSGVFSRAPWKMSNCQFTAHPIGLPVIHNQDAGHAEITSTIFDDYSGQVYTKQTNEDIGYFTVDGCVMASSWSYTMDVHFASTCSFYFRNNVFPNVISSQNTILSGSLDEMMIEDNAVNGISDTIFKNFFQTVPVRKLSLRGNGLKSLSLSNSPGTLTYLDISDNQLQEWPSMPQAPSLQTLLATDNHLTSLDSIRGLSSLQILSVDRNQISGGLGTILSLPLLTSFTCSYNLLSGLIPNNITILKSLTTLDVSHNRMTGIVPNLTALIQLNTLNASNNQLTGNLAGIAAVVSLSVLDLSQNQMVGNTTALNKLSSLVVLDLSNNAIGPFSALNFTNLMKLRNITMNNCSLQGVVPQSFNGLSRLQRASFTDNAITSFFHSPANLSSLRSLTLTNNHLFDSADFAVFQSASSLQVLELGGNRYTSALSHLNGTISLQSLDLSQNELNEDIASLPALPSLTYLDISYNRMYGVLTTYHLPALNYLYASHNSLQGSFPDITDNRALITVDLSHNLLTALPSLSSTSLQNLYVQSNQMNGSIPDLTALASLIAINVSDNVFTDNFFSGESLDQVVICDMTHNAFECPITRFSSSICRAECNTPADNTAVAIELHVEGSPSTFNSTLFLSTLSELTYASMRRMSMISIRAGSVIATTKIQPAQESDRGEGTAKRTAEILARLSQPGEMLGGYKILSEAIINPPGVDVTGNDNRTSTTSSDGLNDRSTNNVPIPIIIGAVVGGFVLLVILMVIVFFVYRKTVMKMAAMRQFKMVDMTQIDMTPVKKSVIDYDDIKGMQMIGSGAFGVVYKAKWRETQVAVKQIRAEYVTQAQVEDFLREARIFEGLKAHPNIVMFIGMTFPPQPLSIVTEYCAGGSLYPYLRRKSCSMEEKRKLMSEIALGMLHLHKEKVIHRDLAVRNILLSKHCEAKVADFGLSRTQESTDEASHTVSTIGPAKWMSPEAITSRQYSTKSDGNLSTMLLLLNTRTVFSFGVVMWEIIQVKDPWPQYDALSAAVAVTTRGERLEIPQETPTDIECWLADPSERPDFGDICSLLRVKEAEQGWDGVDSLRNTYVSNFTTRGAIVVRFWANKDIRSFCRDILSHAAQSCTTGVEVYPGHAKSSDTNVYTFFPILSRTVERIEMIPQTLSWSCSRDFSSRGSTFMSLGGPCRWVYMSIVEIGAVIQLYPLWSDLRELSLVSSFQHHLSATMATDMQWRMTMFIYLIVASISALLLPEPGRTFQTSIDAALRNLTSGDLVITFVDANYTDVQLSLRSHPQVNVQLRGPVRLHNSSFVAVDVGNLTFQDVHFDYSLLGLSITTAGTVTVNNCSFFGFVDGSPVLQPSLSATDCSGVTIAGSTFSYLRPTAIALKGKIPKINITNTYFTQQTPYLSPVITITTDTSELFMSGILADLIFSFGVFTFIQFTGRTGNVTIMNSNLFCTTSSVFRFHDNSSYGTIRIANNVFRSGRVNSQLALRNITTQLVIIRDNSFPNTFGTSSESDFLPIRSSLIFISGRHEDVHVSGIIASGYRTSLDSAFLLVGSDKQPAKINNLHLDGLYVFQNQLTPVMIYNSTVFNLTIDSCSFLFNSPVSKYVPLAGAVTLYGSIVNFTRISDSLFASNQGVSTIYITETSSGAGRIENIVIDNITATYNIATTSGGVIYVSTNVSQPQIIISNSQFTSNTAWSKGGGVYVSGCGQSSGIYNCTFSYNQAGSNSGEIKGGGAIYLYTPETQLFIIDGCDFQSNTSPGDSTAVLSLSPLRINDCRFTAHPIGRSVIVSNNSGHLEITRTTFDDYSGKISSMEKQNGTFIVDGCTMTSSWVYTLDLVSTSERSNRLTVAEEMTAVNDLHFINNVYPGLLDESSLKISGAMNKVILENNMVDGFSDTMFSHDFTVVPVRTLSLRGNRLNSVSLFNIPKGLMHLDLSYNQLQTLPLLSDFSSLRILLVNDNHLTSLDSIRDLASLQVLSVDRNDVTGGLGVMTSLPQLIHFTCSFNQMDGAMPNGIMMSKNLTLIDISNNKITGEIPDLTSLGQLSVLNVSNNELKGSLKGIASLKRLSVFDSSRNQLIDNATSLNNLSSLVIVDLSHNTIGQFSALDFTKMTKLRNITMNNCSLQGVVPQSFNGLSQLQRVSFTDNTITSLTHFIANLSSLESLSLTNNALSDTEDFSVFRSASSSLRILELGGNGYTSALRSLDDMSSLQTVDLSRNGLSDDIKSLPSLPTLQVSLPIELKS
ncbi:DNA-directed RNA polymerase subunit beta, partial [Planoprotostelium fungivorum]